MRAFAVPLIAGVVLAFYGLTGCAKTAANSPDVSSAIRQSLNQVGRKDVSVDQDRAKGAVTLSVVNEVQVKDQKATSN